MDPTNKSLQSMKAVPKAKKTSSFKKTKAAKKENKDMSIKSSSVSSVLTPGDRIMNKRGNLKFIVRKNSAKRQGLSCRHKK